jgi:hypothetical protein
MRWERDAGEIIGLLVTTARPPLWVRMRPLLPGVLLGLLCVVLVASPLLLLS